MRYQISKGYKSFGGQDIFENIAFEVKDKEKVAIVGRNGCGKTTLMRIIAGEEQLDSGEIHRDKNLTIGYLAQTKFFDENNTVEVELEKIFDELHIIEKQLKEVTTRMETDHGEKLLERYGQLQIRHENLGGYTYKNEINNVFTRFGFSIEEMQKRICEFSGGQKTRLAFVKLLLEKPDILLLDEPTNHLDIDTIEWLEGYVAHYPKAVVMVSHDRSFLDALAEVVYEMEFNRLTKFTGNYSHYVEAKKALIEKNRSAYARQQKEISDLEELIEKFRYKKNKAKFAQSKIKYLERMDRIEKTGSENKKFSAHFRSRIKGGRQVLKVKELVIGYDKPLCTVDLELLHGQRIAVIGANGQGKSTFLKTLMHKVKPLGGSFLFGHQIEIGYFDQENKLESKGTVLETIWDNHPELDRTQIRTVLGSFLFSGDEVFKDVDVLSGGEKVRLSLLELMLQQSNLLILDEPTNHLDITGKEALEDTLLDFDGTMLFVSHDRYFINKLATGILQIENGKAVYFPLNFKDFETKEHESNNNEIKMVVKEKQKNINYGKELSKVESKITKKEEELEDLRALRFEPEFYQDAGKMKELDEQIDGVHTELDHLMKQWEEYSEAVEAQKK